MKNILIILGLLCFVACNKTSAPVESLPPITFVTSPLVHSAYVVAGGWATIDTFSLLVNGCGEYPKERNIGLLEGVSVIGELSPSWGPDTVAVWARGPIGNLDGTGLQFLTTQTTLRPGERFEFLMEFRWKYDAVSGYWLWVGFEIAGVRTKLERVKIDSRLLEVLR